MGGQTPGNEGGWEGGDHPRVVGKASCCQGHLPQIPASGRRSSPGISEQGAGALAGPHICVRDLRGTSHGHPSPLSAHQPGTQGLPMDEEVSPPPPSPLKASGSPPKWKQEPRLPRKACRASKAPVGWAPAGRGSGQSQVRTPAPPSVSWVALGS